MNYLFNLFNPSNLSNPSNPSKLTNPASFAPAAPSFRLVVSGEIALQS